MRQLAACLFVLVFATSIAIANDFSINTIVGYVELAERRLAEGDHKSARANLESAREMMPKASAEAKADRQYSQLGPRMAKIDKAIAAKEAAAAKVEESDDKLDKADRALTQARSDAGVDSYDKAAAAYKSCIGFLEEAATIDPTVKSRSSRSSITYPDLLAKCREGHTEMAKLASGEGRNVGDTEEGKAALEGFRLATKAAGAKKLAAADLVAGLQGADVCKRNVGTLTSTYLRNGNKAWDQDKHKLGTLTLREMWAQCEKLENQLENKPAFGCGKRHVGVSQHRPSVVDRWRAVQVTPKHAFTYVDCKDMPKKSVFPGASAKFKAKFQSSCGRDAVYVIIHNRWLEYPTQRQMSGECWKKGNLTFVK